MNKAVKREGITALGVRLWLATEKVYHDIVMYIHKNFMLGVFDSGYGGLTILKAIHGRLPSISTIYLGDNARAPYGTRAPAEILAFTREGVRFLFERGCPLVILACNTASADALRTIQQTLLPEEYPHRRILGVIRPTAEAIRENPKHHIGIFATPATVNSCAYARELAHLGPFSVTQQACPGLVDAIERGETETSETADLVASFVAQLLQKDPAIKTVLLGCTHYPLILPLFRTTLPGRVNIIIQGPTVAEKLADYLARHQEIDTRLAHSGTREFFTTGIPNNPLASYFYKNEILFNKICLTENPKKR